MKTLAEKLKSEQCRRILAALENGPKSADELVLITKLTLGSVNKHLEVLIVADQIKVSRSGKFSK
jgi:DNA-binding transcriptional ArsR family regulator